MVKNHGMDKIFTCSTIGERSLRAKNLGLELSIRASLGLPALNVWLTSLNMRDMARNLRSGEQLVAVHLRLQIFPTSTSSLALEC